LCAQRRRCARDFSRATHAAARHYENLTIRQGGPQTVARLCAQRRRLHGRGRRAKGRVAKGPKGHIKASRQRDRPRIGSFGALAIWPFGPLFFGHFFVSNRANRAQGTLVSELRASSGPSARPRNDPSPLSLVCRLPQRAVHLFLTMHQPPPFRSPKHLRSGRFFLVGVWVCLGGSLLAIGGCADPLLAPDEPRSQYDRYDAARDQRAASTYFDEFGYSRPNLRGRLLPRE
jgi:hypothetical protein